MPNSEHLDGDRPQPGADYQKALPDWSVPTSSRRELVAAYAEAGERVLQDLHQLLLWWLKHDPANAKLYLEIYAICITRITEIFRALANSN